MEKINLAPRLKMLSELVPDGCRLADVGTDHGWLPIYLSEQGRIRYAVATDIRPGPLERARAHAAERHTVNMDCVLCDGLQGIAPHAVDCVVIAGMGGDSISDILSAAPWTRENTRLILQPMSKPEVLRSRLGTLGLRVLDEYLVEDNHRIYPILVCEGGEADPYTDAQLYTGLLRLNRSPGLFVRMKERTQRLMEKALEGVSLSSDADREGKMQYISSILQELASMEVPMP